MTQLKWGQAGEKTFESGVDHGVLYIPDLQGDYTEGVAWNGLTAVTESPSGAESNKQYADNTVYLNLVSAEEFGGTIEAFTYPDEFEQCDGTAEIAPGVTIGQQNRKNFGFSYRTKIGNDILGADAGYKLHLVYGALASVSERAHNTVNDSPEATTFSWEVTTTPIEVPGFKPTASLTINSLKVSPTNLAALEEILYGTEGTDPRLPKPEEVQALFAGAVVTTAQPTQPGYNATTKVITIPAVTGVIYQVNGVTKAAGPLPAITKNTVVTAKAAAGYKLPTLTDNDWFFSFA